jgi:hypothetical protein
MCLYSQNKLAGRESSLRVGELLLCPVVGLLESTF